MSQFLAENSSLVMNFHAIIFFMFVIGIEIALILSIIVVSKVLIRELAFHFFEFVKKH